MTASPALGGREITIRVAGSARRTLAGRSLAAALLDLGIRKLRQSPRAGGARGAFCMMGACQECLVRVDGRLVQACMVAVADSMDVRLDATP